MSNFLKMAEAEAADLRRRLQILEKLIAEYGGTAPSDKKPVTPLAGNIEKSRRYGRQGSVSANALEAAEAFLHKVNRRAMSGEILNAIQDKVHIPGQTPASTLSSYLSTSELFDNVKGEGYGLTEWRSGRRSIGDQNE